MKDELQELGRKNSGKYIFSFLNGEKPISANSLNKALHLALRKIGIGDGEQERRNLSFHGWRHFFNTTMRANNINDGKLQKLTGHKSQQMTEHYTHFKAEDFKDVEKVQTKIIQMPRKAG